MPANGEHECKMSISDRKKKILGALVDEYIKTAEPVGSKAIAGLPIQIRAATAAHFELSAIGRRFSANAIQVQSECAAKTCG